MPLPLINPRDLEFQLYEVLGAESLTARARYVDHSRETFDAVIATARQIAEMHLLPHRHDSDAHEPYVHDGRVVTPEAVGLGVRAMAEDGRCRQRCGNKDRDGIGLTFVLRSSFGL